MSTDAAFGPWRSGLGEPERMAQLRALAALTAVFCGSGHRLVASLRAAEHDEGAAATARELLGQLPSRVRRKILSVFGRITYGF